MEVGQPHPAGPVVVRIDVGIDRRSPVSWSMHRRHGSFAFTGALHHVAYQPGAPAPDSPMAFLDMLRDWGRSFE